jgi:hypothetical protein
MNFPEPGTARRLGSALGRGEPVREVLVDLWPDALQRLKLAMESRPKP